MDVFTMYIKWLYATSAQSRTISFRTSVSIEKNQRKGRKVMADEKDVKYSDSDGDLPSHPEWRERQPVFKFIEEINYLRDQYARALFALREAGLQMNVPEDLIGGIRNLAQIATTYRDMSELHDGPEE